MKAIVLLIGSLIVALGIVGLVTPEVLLAIGGRFATPTGLFVAALLRVALGLMFIKVAHRSRFPFEMRVLGVFVVLAGLLTPVVGVERAHAWITWWSERGPFVMRSLALVVLALGAFIVYANTPRRRALRVPRSAT